MKMRRTIYDIGWKRKRKENKRCFLAAAASAVSRLPPERTK